MFDFMCEQCGTVSYSASREAANAPCDKCGGQVHLMTTEEREEEANDRT